MKTHQTDRRVLRTRKMIRDALTQLITEVGLEKITVSMLTEKANINRGTFYLHYRGIHDLVEKSEDEIILQILSIRNHALKEHERAGYTEPTKEIFLQFSIKLCTFFKENCSFLDAILGPNGNPSFHEKLKTVLENELLLHTRFQVKVGENIIPNDYLVAYLSAAHIGILYHWLKNGTDIPPKEMAYMITELAFNSPFQLSEITLLFNKDE